MASSPSELPCSAWRPGVSTGIPHEFRALETLYRSENTFSSAADTEEMSRFTGLPCETLVRFRSERLALHELIIRVTSDVAVAEGEQEEDFGKNFRKIALTLFHNMLAPRMEEIQDCWQSVVDQALTEATTHLNATLFAKPDRLPVKRRWWPFGKASFEAPESPEDPNQTRLWIDEFQSTGQATPDPFKRALFGSLTRVLDALLLTRGTVGSDVYLLAHLIATDVGNRHGSQCIGQWIDKHFSRALANEGFNLVPRQTKPVLISLKGASAAGKSSLRPMIKQVLRARGIEPEGYATISPDVWRRLLLDYESLGPATKYAGHLTSRELMVIDGKLDRYIRAKANREQALPHLIVDRFRFDSFSSEKVARVLHKTYAHHVDTLLMYFVVTPPEETVERGWQRGLERGRYKAVEDFLGHCVEAYEGMPKLLFKWLAYDHPSFKFTFLDNRVPKGCFPKTIATGDQKQMELFAPEAMIDIVRYQRINVHAASPEEVYSDSKSDSLAENAGFLEEILRRIPEIRFQVHPGEAPYAHSQHGRFTVLNAAAILRLPASTQAVVEHLQGLAKIPA